MSKKSFRNYQRRSYRNRKSLTNEDKVRIAIRYLARADRMIAWLDITWLHEKRAVAEIANMRIHISNLMTELSNLLQKQGEKSEQGKSG